MIVDDRRAKIDHGFLWMMIMWVPGLQTQQSASHVSESMMSCDEIALTAINSRR